MKEIKIENVKTSDAKEILDIYSYYIDNTAITFETTIPSLEEFTQRTNSISSKYPYIVAKIDDKIVGYAYANTYRARAAYQSSVELSVYLKEGTTNKGMGTRLYDELFKRLKGKYHMAFSCITYPNDQSVNFHYKYGFKMIGIFKEVGFKFNKFQDTCWMQKEIEDE